MDSKQERIKYIKNKIDQLNARQLCIKVYTNSVYGYFGNKQAPIGDDDIASSITLTGQAIIREASKLAEKYVSDQVGKEVKDITVLSDTDSVVGETIISTNTGYITIKQLFDKFSNEQNYSWSQYGHEFVNVSTTGLTVGSYDEFSCEVYFAKVAKLIRHKVSKGKYRISAIDGIKTTNSVTMTEDHGCIVYRKTNDLPAELVRVSPKEIKETDKLVIYEGNYTEQQMRGYAPSVDMIVEYLGEFKNEYVYDIEMDDANHVFFANDILVHNSVYLSLAELFAAKNLEFTKKGKLTKDAYFHAEALNDTLNNGIKEFVEKETNSKDCRIEFKREIIADTVFPLAKKRYVAHVLDDEGIPCDKWKYTGVDVVRTSMPKAIKPHVKHIIETMISTKNQKDTNNALMGVYDIFNALGVIDIAKTSNISNYDKYANGCNEFETVKRMPCHVKAAYFYNLLIKKHNLLGKYEPIASGDKIKYFYLQQPNKYGIDCIAFKYVYPVEFEPFFKPDREKMFEKVVYAAIEHFYDAVKWNLRKPSEALQTDLFELFG